MGEGILIYGVPTRNRTKRTVTSVEARNNINPAKRKRDYLLGKMRRLYGVKVQLNGNGHPIKVGFNRLGNKHLYHNALHGRRGILPGDLSNMDRILSGAKFVKKSGLHKSRPKDDIKRFYYYKTSLHGDTVYLHVAETDFFNKRGSMKHKRFLYAATTKLK